MKKALTALAVLQVFCGAALLAEQEFRLAKGLSDMGTGNLALFLLERQAKRGVSPAETSAAKGYVLKSLGDRESDPARKVRTYDSAQTELENARKLCREGDALYIEVDGLLGDLDLLRARTHVKALQDEKDLDKKAELRREALTIFTRVLASFKKAADAAMAAYNDVKKKVDTLDKETIAKQNLEAKLAKLADAAVNAMQRYFRSCFEAVDVYEENSADRNAFVEKVVAEAEVFTQTFSEHELVSSWGHFARGIMLCKGGKYDAAASALDDPIQIDKSDYDRRAWELIDGIRKPAYYYKAKSQLDGRRYQDAENTSSSFMLDYRDALNEEWGQAILMIMAEAQWAQAKHKPAIETLKKGIRLHASWEANYRQKLSDWFDWAEKNNKELVKLFEEPDTLYAIAQGAYQGTRYPEAIKRYRKCISACRRPETARATRLRYEPPAWYEMGLSFYKLNRAYEAALAWSEVVLNFSERFLLDEDKQNKEVFDKAVEISNKAMKNALAVISQRAKATRNPADLRLVTAMQDLDVRRGSDPEAYKYTKGMNKMKEAENYKTPAKRRDIYKEADALLKEVPSNSKFYESSLWQRGYCAHKIVSEHYREWTEVKKQNIPKDTLDEMKRLAKDMDGFFASQELYADRHPTFDKTILDTRTSRKATTPVLRLLTYFYIGDYEEGGKIAAASAPLITLDNANYRTFYWHYMKGLSEQAKMLIADKQLQQADTKLKAVDDLIPVVLKHPQGKDMLPAAYTIVGAIYLDMAKATDDKKLSDEYKRKAADHFAALISPDDPPDRIYRVAVLFFQLGAYDEARKWFDIVLQKLDPDGDNKTTDIPETLFDDLSKHSMYDDEKKTDLIRKYVGDLKARTIVTVSIDYTKAKAIIDAILKQDPNHPDKDYFDKIRTEIDNRNIILSSRTKNVECYMALARAASSDPAAAKALYEQAEKDSLALLAFWPMNVDIIFNLGEISFALAKYTDAGYYFDKATKILELGSDRWILADRRRTESQAMLAEIETNPDKKKELAQIAWGFWSALRDGTSIDDILTVWPEFAEFEKKLLDMGAVPPKVKIGPVVEQISKSDQDLWTDLSNREKFMVSKQVTPEEIKTGLVNTLTGHFYTRISSKMNTLEAQWGREIKTEQEAKLWRRRYLLEILIAKCVEHPKLRQRIIDFGGMSAEEMEKGIPIRYWPAKERSLAEKEGLIDAQGNLLIADPLEELRNIGAELDKFRTVEEKEE